ncbi:5'-nucleotidase C-terminal domain-containing protein [Spongiivirga citrea]|uniref:5'-Nucleotidase C-terminal domain-containing protein n=1 Tax=Spongiivirga citrea TaxID=1481457 RepID=A0A6M0CIB7_9FLAO|nr:5'-nucleotidase C-terminal domain-containing protein [Spongiivirga citrea]NER17621.1 hypothetical protein [Spongiivirga citrea]
MKIQQIVLFITFCFLVGCKNTSPHLKTIEAKQLAIDATIPNDPTIDSIVKPYQKRVNEELNRVLSYSSKDMHKNDGHYESTIGNFMADLLLERANAVLEKRENIKADVCLLNHGGIRSAIGKGPINMQHMYDVMPFENTLVAVELSGDKIQEMLAYLSKAKRAHPIAGMTITLDKDLKVVDAKIGGKKIDENKNYLVATSNFLYQGGDNMHFLANPVKYYELDYLIRNAMVDYLQKTDTIDVSLDNRFIQRQ